MSTANDIAAPKLRPIDEGLRSRGIQVFYTTWLRWIRKKGLPAKKVGGRYYIDLDELDRWIAAQGVRGEEPPSAPCRRPAMRDDAARLLLAERSHGRRGRRRRSSR